MAPQAVIDLPSLLSATPHSRTTLGRDTPQLLATTAEESLEPSLQPSLRPTCSWSSTTSFATQATSSMLAFESETQSKDSLSCSASAPSLLLSHESPGGPRRTHSAPARKAWRYLLHLRSDEHDGAATGEHTSENMPRGVAMTTTKKRPATLQHEERLRSLFDIHGEQI